MNRRKSLKTILVFETKYFEVNNVENGHLYPKKRKGKPFESHSWIAEDLWKQFSLLPQNNFLHKNFRKMMEIVFFSPSWHAVLFHGRRASIPFPQKQLLLWALRTVILRWLFTSSLLSIVILYTILSYTGNRTCL